jgi:ABC-2 type transport system ATP-binding protein
MIAVQGLTKKFGSLTAVEDISFNIKDSEIFGFLGPNGAGKTTTIRMLAALISPTSGNIDIDGRNPSADGAYIRSITGLLTESPGLYEKISAYENLRYFSSFYDTAEHKKNSNIEKYLKMFGLWERKDDPAGTYSKGMKQKLALCRALIHEPKILLLDEPTAGLDPESAHMVRSFIESLKQEKITVFLCTHNLNEASSLSDRVCFIKRKIIKIASLAELQEQDNNKRIELVFKDNAAGYRELLESINPVRNVEINDNRALISVEDPAKSNPLIIRELIKNNIDILYINEIRASLEDIYLELIRDRKER